MKQKKTELKSRFIPVYTGNTRITTLLWSLTAVHPRIHGEHGSSLSEMPLMAGSSPYTRGTLIHLTSFLFSARFIPVYTGNTNEAKENGIKVTVHPRIHGEHILNCVHKIRNFWFIPVYTGNTSTLALNTNTSSVHPRIHGEHSESFLIHAVIDGSSPYTRGTL